MQLSLLGKNLLLILIGRKWLLGISFLSSFILEVNAQERILPENYFLNFDLNTQTKLYRDQNNSQKNQTLSTFSLLPAYQITKDLQFLAYIGVEKELEQERKARLVNSFISLNSPLYISDKNSFLIIGDFRVILPTDEENRRNSSFIGRIFAAPSFIFNLTEYGLKNFSVVNRWTFNRDFYHYETRRDGVSNTLYGIGNKTSLNYNPIEKLGLSVSYNYLTAWSHQHNRKNDQYILEQEINYFYRPNLRFTFGHSNEDIINRTASGLTPIRLKDEKNSTIYININKGL